MRRRQFIATSLALTASVAFRTPNAWAAPSDDLPILSRLGKPLLLTRAEVDEFRAALHGPLLLRGNEGYEQARRIWNGAFDRHPAAIVRCHDASDVRHAVQFAASHDLLIAVRGGGHSLPGHSVCEGGLMIDLAPMRAVAVDPKTRVARVQPGVLLGELDRSTQAHGLIVPAGTVSHTGVAGLTLGGGFGRLSRALGLTVDALQEADVVLADGRAVRASADENADLFWALRGGGGNFGVVTAFAFRPHELARPVIGGDLVYPFAKARQVLGELAELSARAPDELWVDPVLECDENGDRRLLVNLCHCGKPSQATKDVDALRRLHRPEVDTVGARPFATLQSAHDAQSPHGRAYYMGGGFVTSLSPALLDHAVAAIQEPGAELGKISLTQHGGAIARVPVDATAFANRGASHNIVVRAAWDDPSQAEARTAWQKKTWQGFVPFSRGAYANLNLPAAEAKVLGAYGANMPRLRALKGRFDPKNLFHLNPNIPPPA